MGTVVSDGVTVLIGDFIFIVFRVVVNMVVVLVAAESRRFSFLTP